MLSHGSFLIFFNRPISMTFLMIAIFLLVSPFVPVEKRPKGEISIDCPIIERESFT